jgi:transposase InsO family protein
MVGKLHKSWPGGHVYMLVAVDKFTKWVEAAPVIIQDSTAAINFIKFIVFRFGVPHNIITDNGTNFTSKEFKNYCEGLGIKLKFASVAHPKTNGQVKKANGLICNRIKKRLLAPLEKGPYIVIEVIPGGAYRLQDKKTGKDESNPWNAEQLRRFYA